MTLFYFAVTILGFYILFNLFHLIKKWIYNNYTKIFNLLDYNIKNLKYYNWKLWRLWSSLKYSLFCNLYNCLLLIVFVFFHLFIYSLLFSSIKPRRKINNKLLFYVFVRKIQLNEWWNLLILKHFLFNFNIQK